MPGPSIFLAGELWRKSYVGLGCARLGRETFKRVGRAAMGETHRIVAMSHIDNSERPKRKTLSSHPLLTPNERR
jgi:hypothetical protein